MIDETGDRKDGARTAHVGRQYLGRFGKIDNGVVSVAALWADERVYYPVHVEPYTPAALRVAQERSGVPHQAADRRWPGGQGPGGGVPVPRGGGRLCLRRTRRLPRRAAQGRAAVRARLKPRRGTWASGPHAHALADAARAAAWDGPTIPATGNRWPAPSATDTPRPGGPPTRRWAGGLDGARRLVVATADPATLPGKATWYLVTNLPRPGGPREETARAGRAPGRDRADLRHPPLDRAELQAGQGRARLGRLPGPLRHRDPPPPGAGQLRVQLLLGRLVRDHPAPHQPAAPRPGPGRGERGAARSRPPAAPPWPRALRAIRAWLSPWIALQRWWPAWSAAPPPPQLQALMNSVAAGCGLHLYIRN